MNNDILYKILVDTVDHIEGSKGYWKFEIKDISFMCLTDELHNRMRIIAPIVKANTLNNDKLTSCMKANFHTALDIKYAISDGILWATFIHPLKELTKHQVIDALSQVFSGVKTFGSTYSSGSLSFLTDEERKSRLN